MRLCITEGNEKTNHDIIERFRDNSRLSMTGEEECRYREFARHFRKISVLDPRDRLQLQRVCATL